MMPLEAFATWNQAVKFFLEVIKGPNQLRSTDQNTYPIQNTATINDQSSESSSHMEQD